MLLVVALLAATGGHWLFLQSVAWTTMLSDNLQEYSFTEAVQRTFDGEHPCQLCSQIKEGKKSEKKSELQFHLKKLEFISVRPVLVFAAPDAFRIVKDFLPDWNHQTQRPPVPPPRELFA